MDDAGAKAPFLSKLKADRGRGRQRRLPGPDRDGVQEQVDLIHETGGERDPAPFKGVLMGINYGFDKVRFINPVKVGSKIRAKSVLSSVDLKDPNTIQYTRTMTVEIEGEDKPALVAEWISRLIYS